MKNITLSTAFVFALSCTNLFAQNLKPVRSTEPLVCRVENKTIPIQVKTAPSLRKVNPVYQNRATTPTKIADIEERTLSRNTPAKIKAGEVKAYPNPFTNDLSVSINDAAISTASYEAQLFDLQGKKVFSQAITTNQTMLMPNGITAGMYFLHILKNGTVVLKEKVIKQ